MCCLPDKILLLRLVLTLLWKHLFKFSLFLARLKIYPRCSFIDTGLAIWRSFLCLERIEGKKWTPSSTRSFYWHSCHMGGLLSHNLGWDTPNFLLGWLSGRVNDLMHSLLIDCALWDVVSIAKLGDTFKTKEHIWSGPNILPNLNISAIMLHHSLSILTTFVIEKVLWKEIACCNRWRLPPFILSGHDSVAHTLRWHLFRN